jgi:predicted nucleic acid-binding protein
LDRPMCVFTDLHLEDVPEIFRLLKSAGTAGNLTTDAQLAAIALRTGAVIYSADTDFAKFPGLPWVNPILSGGTAP